MKSPLTLTLAAVLAVSATAPALAQPYYNESEYQQRLRDWQAQRDAYEARRQAYEADRNAYDNRYNYDARQPYARDVYATTDPYRHYRDSPCERRSSSSSSNRQAAGTIIGALVGGALGTNIASHKVQTEGAVLGAVVGGALGAGIANGTDDTRYGAACDTT